MVILLPGQFAFYLEMSDALLICKQNISFKVTGHEMSHSNLQFCIIERCKRYSKYQKVLELAQWNLVK